MQLCDVDVCLAGDRNHVVPKRKVSVAEIEVLRAVHGDDAIQNIKPRGQERRSTAEELDRLRRLYRGNVATEAGLSRGIVDQVFRGPRPSLPTALKDIGLDYKGEDKPSRSKKKAEAAEESGEESLME